MVAAKPVVNKETCVKKKLVSDENNEPVYFNCNVYF
jgi:hypothetical protein